MTPAGTSLLFLYFLVLVILGVFGVHRYAMVYLYTRHKDRKAGFKVFGRRRETQLMGGRRWDTIYMDALASEFTSPVLAEIFAPDTPRS